MDPFDTGSSIQMVASLGFEPRQSDSESLVLPLHHEAKERDGKSNGMWGDVNQKL